MPRFPHTDPSSGRENTRREMSGSSQSGNDGSPRRLFLFDDNIRDVGGHFFELATLLSQGACQLGYEPILATHQAFADLDAIDPAIQCVPTFRTRRMIRWSLGVDGKSAQQRDIDGRPVGGTLLQNLRSRATDWMIAPAKSPSTMIRRWSEDFAGLLKSRPPRPCDSLLINTGDDFAMLAITRGLHLASIPHRQRVDVVFHFAIHDSQTLPPRQWARASAFAGQVNQCMQQLSHHDVRLHATTEALAGQLRQSGITEPINPIPYPTRQRPLATGSRLAPLRIVMAGLPRAEKGRQAIHDLLLQIHEPLLKTNQFRVSMQMPAERWQPMVPTSLHADFERAMQQTKQQGTNGDAYPSTTETPSTLEVMTENLTTADYHQWLDSADVGLFLYEPDRYVARCSGVLLEMMTRGIPVIVPDGCWLADKVRQSHGDIGLIYQDRGEIPARLSELLLRLNEIRSRCVEHAKEISQMHDAVNTLRQIGLDTARQKAVA
ncbi:glycosyltransferase family protein [Stieleria varia]|uniref:Glycosyl transferases group 1 n=1 Tax=Stieleria varia TaxID=2528005 RepID=A0A5C6B8I4_9BACT|nr:glycosyltransferase family 4 protein [Stieleria varia]TWU07751.1 hypothetical protein Pla52n_03240 [Stieleria varia]